jgi:hypothetical protein
MERPERGEVAHRHPVLQRQGPLFFFFFVVQEQVISLRSPLPIPMAIGICADALASKTRLAAREVLRLLTPKSCYPSGESVPEPPFVAFWEFYEFLKSIRSKKKGQPGEDLPRISNDKLQNSKVEPCFL